MTRDEFMTKARAEVATIFGRHENHIMNLIAQAWAEGKKNAEAEQICKTVQDALIIAQEHIAIPPVQPVVYEPVPYWQQPGYKPPTITCNNTNGDAQEGSR